MDIDAPDSDVYLFALPRDPQTECLLFTKLPAEVRALIFSYALTDYPDPTSERKYTETTCYTRPNYFAPRKSDTALLQTCRAVYVESWFLPFQLREQVHWLAEKSRCPPEYSPAKWQRQQNAIRSKSLYMLRNGNGKPEIKCMRVFAQMYKLEQGQLAKLLQQYDFDPRQLILTIRHADWWNWEVDRPLYFDGGWIEKVGQQLPASVREFCIEIETLSRKREQLVEIAKQMSEKWFIRRKDGEILYPDVTRQFVTENWVGSSKWHDRRWIRDECVEGQLEYDVMTIAFRPAHIINKGGAVSDTARQMAEDEFDASKMQLFYGKTPPAAHRFQSHPIGGKDYVWVK